MRFETIRLRTRGKAFLPASETERVNYSKMTKIVRLIFLAAQVLASNRQKIKFTP